MKILAALLLLLLPVAPAAPVPHSALGIHPQHVRFGRKPFESNTLRQFEIRNRTRETLLVTVEQVRVGDDFSPGQVVSTCPLGDSLLAPGQTCAQVVGFRPSEFFAGRETAIMRVVARDGQGRVRHDQRVKLSGTGFQP